MIFIKNIDEYNPNKKCKTFMGFDDMIADMVSNKKFNPIVKELLLKPEKQIEVYDLGVAEHFTSKILYKKKRQNS